MTEEYEINKYFHNPDLPAEMLIEFGDYLTALYLGLLAKLFEKKKKKTTS